MRSLTVNIILTLGNNILSSFVLSVTVECHLINHQDAAKNTRLFLKGVSWKGKWVPLLRLRQLACHKGQLTLGLQFLIYRNKMSLWKAWILSDEKLIVSVITKLIIIRREDKIGYFRKHLRLAYMGSVS